MNILVTGSAGFIGRSVKAELWSRGHDVVEFDLPLHDITDKPDVLRTTESVDAIVSLAGCLGTAELFETPELPLLVNAGGALNLLEACRFNGCSYVGILMPYVFPSLYSASKMYSERIATCYHKAYDVGVSHVRAFNAFGPGQAHGPGHPQKILPTFAVEAWAGRPIPIWGSGEQGCDLVHTSDLGRMLADAVNFHDEEVFDGGTGQKFSVNEVAAMVLEITGSKAGIEYLPMRLGEEETQIVATGEGWNTLGWKPEFRPEQFEEAVVWYRDVWKPH